MTKVSPNRQSAACQKPISRGRRGRVHVQPKLRGVWSSHVDTESDTGGSIILGTSNWNTGRAQFGYGYGGDSGATEGALV